MLGNSIDVCCKKSGRAPQFLWTFWGMKMLNDSACFAWLITARVAIQTCLKLCFWHCRTLGSASMFSKLVINDSQNIDAK